MCRRMWVSCPIVKRLAAVVLGSALAVGASACSGGGTDLTVYVGRAESLVGPLLEKFEEESGLSVDIRYDDSVNLALLLETEGGKTPADVFFSQSPGALGYLDGLGLLEPLPSSVTSLVSSELSNPGGTWVGITGRVRVIAYNTELVSPDELPASVLDLTAPEFSGQVGVAPSNGSFQDFVSAMRGALGDDATAEWLAALADNDAKVFSGNTEIIDAVARGEVKFGLVNQYYALKAKSENPDSPVDNYFFGGKDVGSVVLVSGAGIMKGSEHTEAAEQLLTFLLSEESQNYFVGETFEFPVVAGIASPGGGPAFEDLPELRTDLSLFGVDFDSTRAMIDASGLATA